MGELDLVDGTDASLAKEDRAVQTRVLVEDAVLDVEGEQVLDLDGSSETKGCSWEAPAIGRAGRSADGGKGESGTGRARTHLVSASPSSKMDEA